MNRDDDLEEVRVRLRLPCSAVAELRAVAQICGVDVGQVVRDIVLWRLGYLGGGAEEPDSS